MSGWERKIKRVAKKCFLMIYLFYETINHRESENVISTDRREMQKGIFLVLNFNKLNLFTLQRERFLLI
jgi:hypothetical protein